MNSNLKIRKPLLVYELFVTISRKQSRHEIEGNEGCSQVARVYPTRPLKIENLFDEVDCLGANADARCQGG